MALWRSNILFLLLLGSLVGCVTPQTELNIKRYGGGFFWVPVIYNGIETEFVLDTGSNMNVVSEGFLSAHSVEIESYVSRSSFTTEASDLDSMATLPDQELRFTRPDSFSIGSIKYRVSGPFLLLDTSHSDKFFGRRTNGIIGTQALIVTNFSIDFSSGSLTIGRQPRGVDLIEPLVVKHGFLYMDVSVNGKTIQFLIDSGSVRSQISMSDFLEVANESSDFQESRGTYINIDGKRESVNGIANVDEIKLGGVELSDFSILVDDSNIIGLDILSRGTLHVDPIRQYASFVVPATGSKENVN